jgi:hypothetical protein
MAKKLDANTARAVRADARELESQAASTGPYPAGTRITRPGGSSRSTAGCT